MKLYTELIKTTHETRKFSGFNGIIEIMKMNCRVMIVWRDWKRDEV